MRYSDLVRRIGGEGAGAWHVHELAWKRLDAGDDVIVLSIGDPDFETPAPIVEAAIASLRAGRTHYSPARGEADLREAIAASATRRAGRPISPEQVFVFPGAQTALFAVCVCLLGHGAEAIVPEPAYTTYEGVVGASGGTSVPAPLRAEAGFRLSPADVSARITPATRAILINSPHNPTGAVLDRATLTELGAICEANDLWLIADEVYADLTYRRPHASALALADHAERTAVVSSLSKSHAMTGWRAGWAIVPEAMAKHLYNLAMCMLYGSPAFIQDAALAALTTALDEPAVMHEAYRRRAEAVVEELSGVDGVACHPPDGGMFVMADIRATGLDGKEFALRLLDQASVAVLPGEGFGPSAAGHVRISLAVDDERLREGCRRLAAVAAGLAADRSRLPSADGTTVPL